MGDAGATPDNGLAMPSKVAKLNGVWAYGDFGLVASKNTQNILKRSFRRACRRALVEGQTSYKGRVLCSQDVPKDLQLKLQAHMKHSTPSTSQSSTALDSRIDLGRKVSPSKPRLRYLVWNAGGLPYDEWMIWASSAAYDLIVATETRMRFTSEWQVPGWTCVHSGHPNAGILVMVACKFCASDGLSWREVLPGRLVHLRLFGRTAVGVIVKTSRHMEMLKKLEYLTYGKNREKIGKQEK